MNFNQQPSLTPQPETPQEENKIVTTIQKSVGVAAFALLGFSPTLSEAADINILDALNRDPVAIEKTLDRTVGKNETIGGTSVSVQPSGLDVLNAEGGTYENGVIKIFGSELRFLGNKNSNVTVTHVIISGSTIKEGRGLNILQLVSSISNDGKVTTGKDFFFLYKGPGMTKSELRVILNDSKFLAQEKNSRKYEVGP